MIMNMKDNDDQEEDEEHFDKLHDGHSEDEDGE